MRLKLTAAVLAGLLLAACDSAQEPATDGREVAPELDVRITEHRDGDDLLTAGLGLEGMAGMPPQPADPAAPTPDELRRMAIHKSWTGIQSFTPAGGLGGLLEELPTVPGREFQAFVTLADAAHPVRVLLQLPDDFDADSPCLVVAPASGSRGVYGAIALAGPWALPAGCAVAYTDKGAGTDFYDYSTETGVALDGTRVAGRQDNALGFQVETRSDDADEATVALKHAHSGDHPEADWGRHVLRAAEFGLRVLSDELDGEFSAENTRVIAAGLSNGGGAVLRAAEQDGDGLLDAVVAVSPNVTAPDAPPLYDYATAAALYQPCLLANLDAVDDMPLGNPTQAAMGEVRCASLVRADLLDEAGSETARARLEALGFEAAALRQSAVNVALDLWRTVAASYASAYLQRGPFDMPCGFAYSAPGATAAQRNGWWALHSGIGAGAGIVLTDSGEESQDKQLPALRCLRHLWTGKGSEARRLHEAVEATRASARLPGDAPVIVIHGADDGLIPPAFSSRPWVEQARENGGNLTYWEVEKAQHFDVLLGAPGVAGRYVPLLPYGWRALDSVNEILDGSGQPGDDRIIDPDPAPVGEPLRWEDLGL
ncbi:MULTISPECIES: 3-hydroxybutyrate oligomer hydrolase family protein [unclassified Wenzhouxiangella]|uniref:3-hydroxybutyrate oligomer hydrolase family protein n=1 Tax=unclassified Wenzhouxiangella TaxID=2613841 RepID=UPI000E326F72|nr:MULTISPECIES: 3-hydroxybutyrate oligomer hydrolase family protein [unclassified Wenzhouxiangella]RFF27612.1 hydrogenase [Wenzhouxiangella sp. 15181]RFP70136.1 hydrogenase [Wenzhouxiangella sp. 15190]